MATTLAMFKASSLLDQARAVAAGLPARAVRDLVADPAVTLADIAHVVGPRRTIDRRLKEDSRLSPEESDRFARFVTILDLAAGVFGSRAAAMHWLGSPKARLGDAPPIDLLASDIGTRLVEDVLQQARHGFTA